RHFDNTDELQLHFMSAHPAELKLSKAPEQLTLSTNDDSLNQSGLHKLVSKFGGLKFDLLSDISRHYQDVRTEHDLSSWPKASKRTRKRPNDASQETRCLEAGYILFSGIQKTEPQSNNLDILSSTACAECCQVNLEASLKEKYDIFKKAVIEGCKTLQ
ncbi:hypothetical protein L195_g003115, partial [Trifolium pratense]